MTSLQHPDRDDPQTDAPGETLGQVVRGLRASVGESQAVFAKRVHRSRPYIADVERGRLHPESFRDELIEAFPDAKIAIQDAYKVTVAQLPPKQSRDRETPLHRKIEAFLSSGRFSYARRAIADGLANPRDAADRYWLQDRLSVALRGLGKDDEATRALATAVEYATESGLQDAELTSRTRLAGRYQLSGAFQAAHATLEPGLRRYPTADRLWLSLGKVLWYEQSFPEAYAALTTARRYGSPKRSVLHARAQVLAEWGSFDAALTDINDYLQSAGDTPKANIIAIRSTRAYIWGHTGRLPKALALFAELGNSESAWVYYRRALCYLHAGQQTLAVEDLIHALSSDGPSLDPLRRAHAEWLLREHDTQHPRADSCKIPHPNS